MGAVGAPAPVSGQELAAGVANGFSMQVPGSRRRALLAVLASLGLLLASAVSAEAIGTDVPPLGGATTTTTTVRSTTSSTATSTTTTTTTTTRPSSSTTSTSTPSLFPGAATSTTTTSTTAPSTADAPAPDSGEGSTGCTGPMPAQLVAMMNSVKRTRANNTKALVAALAPLAQYGLDPTKQALVGFGRFPIAGTTVWSDDWWLQRCGPGWRLHEGVDLFAAAGTPVRAPVDGVVRLGNGGLGGVSVRVTQPNGTYWYLAHLAGIAPGIVEGSQVRTGDVVGFVGNSGDAAGGPMHVHLEIHPGGGPAIPPKPVVDQFVADALARVPALLEAYAKAYASGAPPTQPQLALPDPDLTSLSPRDAMLWASAVNPAGGTFKIVVAEARDALASIDWNAEATARADEAMGRRRARAWVLPLVPVPLARLLNRTNP